jgi:hypothetical protein
MIPKEVCGGVSNYINSNVSVSNLDTFSTQIIHNSSDLTIQIIPPIFSDYPSTNKRAFILKNFNIEVIVCPPNCRKCFETTALSNRDFLNCYECDPSSNAKESYPGDNYGTPFKTYNCTTSNSSGFDLQGNLV